NAGSTVNLVIKSGTNSVHGTTYYFNRHEALSATSPVAAPGSPKRPIRNNQYGFSLGGPIVHNKTFFFSTLEVQKLTAGNTTPTTAPSADWVASANQLLNQLVVGYNCFLQTFTSQDHSADPLAMGLNTGVTDAELSGPPNITINGFAAVGGTQPLGRVDKTIQFTDTLSYATGAHQMKAGGELRVSKLFIFYDSNKRGTFTFDGTVGPWASLPVSAASASLKSLSDFMAGSYATGSIVRGNTHHNYFQNSFDLFFQDAWTATPALTLNFGLRYTYPGVLGASDAPLTNFLPDQGMVSTDTLYPADRKDLSPRVGF